MGGKVNFNHRNFETFTWAAGLSAATEKISIFATFHVPTVHPVRAAKEVATREIPERAKADSLDRCALIALAQC